MKILFFSVLVISGFAIRSAFAVEGGTVINGNLGSVCSSKEGGICNQPTIIQLPDGYKGTINIDSGSNERQSNQTEGNISASTCVSVDSRKGWQEFNLSRSYDKIIHISGGWSVDARSYSPVGAFGHIGQDARNLSPYNQYKYDQRFPFGALLININQELFWIQNPVSLNNVFDFLYMRINDADNALGDNGGSLKVCFGFK